VVDRKVVAAGLWEALGFADREFRRRMPDVFVKVDLIRLDPDRIHSEPRPPVVSTADLLIAECLWCGDDFVAEIARGQRRKFCGQDCYHDMRNWRRRRARSSSA
jgi:hypothetical protein